MEYVHFEKKGTKQYLLLLLESFLQAYTICISSIYIVT